MKTYFVCYAANLPYFYDRQKFLVQMALQEEFNVFALTDNDLKRTQFYYDNIELLSQQRGAGYWLWKPFIISQILNQIEEDSIIFYLDSGDTFLPGVKNKIEELSKDRDIIISTSFFSQKDYTKRDCFHFMNCDSEEYWNAHQVEAGIVAFKNTQLSKKFVNEWLEFCKNKFIVSDLSNISGKPNFPSFIDHRHDQSILTNLCVKYNIPMSNSIRKFAGVNIDDINNYPESETVDKVSKI